MTYLAQEVSSSFHIISYNTSLERFKNISEMVMQQVSKRAKKIKKFKCYKYEHLSI
jgi:hypothetical protein